MLFGVSAVSKELNFRQNTMCQKCGKYSSVSVYMMYSTFSIFAPLFKWGKKYYAVSDLHLTVNMIKYCKRRGACKTWFVLEPFPRFYDSPIRGILQDFQRGRGKKMKISRLVVSAVSFAVSAALLTLSIIDMFQNDEY